MKSLIILFILFYSHLSFSQHHHDPASIHGMLLFGQKTFYFSHLPMFHKPHDYQVILEVEMNQEVAASYQASLAADEEETIYTIVPEKFVLPDMVKNPKEFKIDLFKGHFERGGTFLVSGIASIKKIHFFKKFSSTPNQLKNQYLVIGNQQESFLIHEISAKPDFDMVSKISVDKEFVSGEKIVLTNNFVQEVEEGEVVQTEKMSFIFLKNLYLEFQDLSF